MLGLGRHGEGGFGSWWEEKGEGAYVGPIPPLVTTKS